MLENNIHTAAIFLICSLLFVLAYQDYKDREVSLWLFIGILVIGLTTILFRYSLSFVFEIFLINLLILSILVVGMLGSFAIKKIMPKDILTGFIGAGDLLFLLIIAPFFLASDYIFFIVVSCVLGIMLYWLWFSKMTDSTIPFAGVMSLTLILVILINSFANDHQPFISSLIVLND